MRWLLFSIILFGSLFSGSASSSGKCAKEKDEVDYWNNLMRERVTEMRRTNHRQAKAEFLDCLGRDDTVSPRVPTINDSQSEQSGVRNITRQHIRRSAPRRGFTQDVYVSSYHNFEGAKRDAWTQFFQESQECIHNDGDMKIFVKCANERKYYLEQFNQRWNERTQSLDSSLTKSRKK